MPIPAYLNSLTQKAHSCLCLFSSPIRPIPVYLYFPHEAHFHLSFPLHLSLPLTYKAHFHLSFPLHLSFHLTYKAHFRRSIYLALPTYLGTYVPSQLTATYRPICLSVRACLSIPSAVSLFVYFLFLFFV